MLAIDTQQWLPLQGSVEEWSKAVEGVLGPIPGDLNGEAARGEARTYDLHQRPEGNIPRVERSRTPS
jgi:hypothetical protein